MNSSNKLRFFSTACLWTAVFVFQNFAATAQQTLPWLEEIDVHDYIFRLELSDETDLIKGQATLEIRLLQNLSRINLDLYARQDDGKGMLVTAITDREGKNLNFSQSGHQLQVQFDSPRPAKSIQQLNISYEGIPEDGMIISTNNSGDRTFFGDNWPNRAHHWLPGIDHPSDKATLAFQVTAPEHYQVIGTGQLIEESNLDGQRKYYHWKTDRLLPLKVAVIGAAPFAIAYTGDVDGIPVSSWVFPEQRNSGFEKYYPAKDILAFFHEHLAPYPYEKLANVQSKTRYGGMENAGNIFYYEKSTYPDADVEGLLAHEIAHQWFGNTASEKNWYHVWLSEGFATYFTHYYFEQTYGNELYRERLQGDRKRIIQFAKRSFKPIVNTEVTDFNQVLNTNSYQKGAWVLHMLREKIGTDNFIKGIRTYYDRYKFSNALTADLQAVIEEVSGQDLSSFFEQWLFRAGQPQLQVTSEPGYLVINQVQKEAFDATLEVLITDAQDIEHLIAIPLAGKTTRHKLSGISAIKSLTLDPGTKLLFEEIKE